MVLQKNSLIYRQTVFTIYVLIAEVELAKGIGAQNGA